MLSYINTNARQNNRMASLGAHFHSLQQCTECNAAEVCMFFKGAKSTVCIRSVFKKNRSLGKASKKTPTNLGFWLNLR